MKNLPKEFVLTDFTIEEGNEVLKYQGYSESKKLWKYLIFADNTFGAEVSNEEHFVNVIFPHLPKLSYKEWKEIVSSKKRFDYTNSREDIFYKVIYPIFPKEFLFGNDLEEFLKLVNETFILNDIQLEIIVEHWKEKENILV